MTTKITCVFLLLEDKIQILEQLGKEKTGKLVASKDFDVGTYNIILKLLLIN